MLIREAMSRDVKLVAPTASLQKAAEMMRDYDCGSLPVAEHDQLIGTITDRDITIRATAQGKDPSTTPVREAMTESVYYCFEDQDMDEAMTLMAEHKIRRLPILNREGEVIGILALGDLATSTPRKAEAALVQISRHVPH